eukprot:781384-Amphidinium_carterae.1
MLDLGTLGVGVGVPLFVPSWERVRFGEGSARHSKPKTDREMKSTRAGSCERGKVTKAMRRLDFPTLRTTLRTQLRSGGWQIVLCVVCACSLP